MERAVGLGTVLVGAGGLLQPSLELLAGRLHGGAHVRQPLLDPALHPGGERLATLLQGAEPRLNVGETLVERRPLLAQIGELLALRTGALLVGSAPLVERRGETVTEGAGRAVQLAAHAGHDVGDFLLQRLVVLEPWLERAERRLDAVLDPAGDRLQGLLQLADALPEPLVLLGSASSQLREGGIHPLVHPIDRLLEPALDVADLLDDLVALLAPAAGQLGEGTGHLAVEAGGEVLKLVLDPGEVTGELLGVLGIALRELGERGGDLLVHASGDPLTFLGLVAHEVAQRRGDLLLETIDGAAHQREQLPELLAVGRGVVLDAPAPRLQRGEDLRHAVVEALGGRDDLRLQIVAETLAERVEQRPDLGLDTPPERAELLAQGAEVCGDALVLGRAPVVEGQYRRRETVLQAHEHLAEVGLAVGELRALSRGVVLGALLSALDLALEVAERALVDAILPLELGEQAVVAAGRLAGDLGEAVLDCLDRLPHLGERLGEPALHALGELHAHGLEGGAELVGDAIEAAVEAAVQLAQPVGEVGLADAGALDLLAHLLEQGPYAVGGERAELAVAVAQVLGPLGELSLEIVERRPDRLGGALGGVLAAGEVGEADVDAVLDVLEGLAHAPAQLAELVADLLTCPLKVLAVGLHLGEGRLEPLLDAVGERDDPRLEGEDLLVELGAGPLDETVARGHLLESLAESLLEGLDATGELALHGAEVFAEPVRGLQKLPDALAGLVAVAALLLEAVDRVGDAAIDLLHRLLEVGVERAELLLELGAQVLDLLLALVEGAQRTLDAVELVAGDLEDACAELEPLVELALCAGGALAETVGAADELFELTAGGVGLLDQVPEVAGELLERALVEHAQVGDHRLVLALCHAVSPRRPSHGRACVIGRAHRHPYPANAHRHNRAPNERRRAGCAKRQLTTRLSRWTTSSYSQAPRISTIRADRQPRIRRSSSAG